MNNNLVSTLEGIDTDKSNLSPSFSLLLNDYSNYHTILVILGGIFTAIFLHMTVLAWKRFRSTHKQNPRWSFETKVSASFAALGTVLNLLMGLLVAANASNALHPRAGLSLMGDTLGRPAPHSQMGHLHQAYSMWLQSNSPQMPALIQEKIAERLAWQQPKAVLCGVLLAVLVTIGVRLWHGLLVKSRLGLLKWTLPNRAKLAAGIALIPATLLLMVMFIGNTQATFAPITITMLYG